MNKLSLLAGAALLAMAGAATAQGPGPRPDRPDRDADMTRAQIEARVAEHFARIDANHDGRFTPEEAQTMGADRRAERRTALFDRMDANHDGNVSREEFASAGPRRGGPGMGRRGGRGRHGMGPPPGGPDGPGGPGGPGGPDGPGGRGARLFGADGFVTLAQMRERALARFDRADANHDGTLTAAERREARPGRRGRRDWR